MEMDVVAINHDWNCIEDEVAYAEALGISDAYRDPELLPRIGDDYQVEIPPLISKSAYISLTSSTGGPKLMPSASHEILLGLPISLMWIKEEVKKIKREPHEFFSHLNSFSNKNGQIIQFSLENGLQVKTEKLDLHGEEKNRMHGSKGYRLVPGSLGGIWNDLEEAGFLLGLYIFGKNLVQLQKFVGSKKMGDILSFYYGRFYRSDRYRRWSGCSKIRSRRCVYGHRIFSGSTQQELLSRLLLHASEDRRNTLNEVAKTFGEGKMLLEEYVFTLKATVGLNTLVEAVGIGTGKQDLTGMAMEHLKTNQVAPVRPEIPVGKACSALTPLEITNFLTGGYRLSKARSNDLFWEAVWPRLLAKGWHSEQPGDHSFAAASRHSLVFLIPGIKKFSRRKLVKGNHYFDSVSDVLNKVASDPALLELDVGVDKEENGWIDEKIMDGGDFPDQQRHCYLKPRTPSLSTEVMKFTVVDTSLPNGETRKVRELRGLPGEMMNISAFRIDSSESDEGSSNDTENESDTLDDLCFDQHRTDTSKSTKINGNKDHFSDKDNVVNHALKPSSPIFSVFAKDPEKITKEQKASKFCEPGKPPKGQAVKKTRTRDRKLVPSTAKRRRRLATCEPMLSCTTDASVDVRLKQDEVASNPEREPEQLKLLLNVTDEYPNEKPQPRELIDLNIPISAETESFTTEERTDNEANVPSEDSSMLKTCDFTLDQASSMNSRRQSTRNRPLTTKALEALACGFLSFKPKKHSRDDFPLENAISKPSKRARSRPRITENFSAGVMGFKGDERANGVCKGNSDMFGDERANGVCKGNGDMLSELQV